MDFLLFMIFSMMDVFAVFYFMFRLFKFEMHYSSIIFSGLVMSFISYTMREVYHMPGADIVLQFVLALTFVWLLFRVHLFYASIMLGVSYVAIVAIQMLNYLVFRLFGLITTISDPNDIVIYMMQLISFLILLFAGGYLHRKNIGFDFVPHSQYEKVPLNKKNRFVFLFYFLIVLSMFLMINLFYNPNNSIMILLLAILGIILFSLLSWSYKKDRSDD